MRLKLLAIAAFGLASVACQAQRNTNCTVKQIVTGNSGVHIQYYDTLRIQGGNHGLVSSSSARMGTVSLKRDAQNRLASLSLSDPLLGNSATCPIKLDAQGRPEWYIRPYVSRNTRVDEQGNMTQTQEFAYSPVRFIYGTDGKVRFQIVYEKVTAAQTANPNPQQWTVEQVKGYLWQGENLASSATYQYTASTAEGDVLAPEIAGVPARRTRSQGMGQPLQNEHLVQTDVTTYSDYTRFPNPIREAIAGHPDALVQSKMVCAREETNTGMGEPRVTEITVTPDPQNPNRAAQITHERVGMIGGGTTHFWFTYTCP